jgi:hypothetical protein
MPAAHAARRPGPRCSPRRQQATRCAGQCRRPLPRSQENAKDGGKVPAKGEKQPAVLRGSEKRVTRSQARQAQAISLSVLLERRSVVPKKPEVPSSPLPDIDGEDRANPLYETAYVNDIYGYYRRIEAKFQISSSYMSTQVC